MESMQERLNRIFREALKLEPAERAVYVEQACAGDEQLRAKAASRLEHEAQVPSDFMLLGESRRDPDKTAYKAVAGPVGAGNGLPSRIGPARIVREIARGGMGVIYLGQQEDGEFKRSVAIKVLKRGTDTEAVLDRFKGERQILAAMDHPNIARLYDGGETVDGLPYFMMEFIEGLPIDEYCDAHRLRIDERLRLFRQVCAAVHYVHQNLIVHRDLKPANVLVTKNGVPKLLDFGIAKLVNPGLYAPGAEPTAPELRRMTPEYASPEQIRGLPITTASDVYSLGVMLYELMSGHRPYQLGSRTRAEVEDVVCEKEPVKPSTVVERVETVTTSSGHAKPTTTITPEMVGRARDGRVDRLRRRLAGDIDTIVLRAMRKVPQRRYASAEQLSEDIQRHLDGLPVIARPDTVLYRTGKFIGRHRVGVGAAAVVAASLLVACGGALAAWRAAAGTAEDAIEFATSMFLASDELKNLPGTLPVRQAFLARARDNLETLVTEGEDDDGVQRQLAQSHEKLGDVRAGVRSPNLGDTKGGLEECRKVLVLRQKLADAWPDDPSLQNDLAMSHLKLGDALKRVGNIEEASQHYGKMLDIARALPTADPTYRRTVAVALVAVGDTERRTGRLQQATSHYNESLTIRLQLAQQQPEDRGRQRDLSVVYNRVGVILENAGDLQSALDHYEHALRVRDRLLQATPENSTARRDVAMAQYTVGLAHVALGHVEQAEDYLRRSLQTARDLAKVDAGNARAQGDVARGYDALGQARALAGDWDDALASYNDFCAIARRLAEADPGDVVNRHQVATCSERLGEVSAATGDPAAAAGHFGKALESFDALAREDEADVRWRIAGARCRRELGAVLREAGDVTEARRVLEASRALYQQLLDEQQERAEIHKGLDATLAELARLAG